MHIQRAVHAQAVAHWIRIVLAHHVLECTMQIATVQLVEDYKNEAVVRFNELEYVTINSIEKGGGL